MSLRLTPAVFGALLLIVLYIGFYLGDPALPGNRFDPCCITGWIGWGDQGFYYKSADALARGNLDPQAHWYPLGYSILAAPFWFLLSHRFFIVDGVCLVAAYAAFTRFADRVGVSPSSAAILFLLTGATDSLVFRQWAVPWNTTPSAALIWGLLAVSASHLQGTRRPFLLGLLCAAIPLIRPTDGVVAAICLAWLGIADIMSSRLRWRDVAALIAGIGVLLLPYATLYLAIYGPHPTQYILNSRAVGFTVHNPIWRAYVLLIEPRQWFFAGQGLMARMPWLIFGFAGALWAAWRGGAAALLSVCLIAYCILFLCYVDLLPTGLWRYYNIHYFKWTFPGFGLLAWLLFKELRLRRRMAWTALAVVLLLSCIRVTPRPAGPDEAANAVDIDGPVATEGNTTMNTRLLASDSEGTLRNVIMMRAFPLPSGDGVRLIGLRRNFDGPVAWGPGMGLDMPASVSPERRWAEHVSLGYPCWLPPYPCKKSAAPR
jgi:hypothetical protein